jgi:isocitrate/methylisocitrate lyase
MRHLQHPPGFALLSTQRSPRLLRRKMSSFKPLPLSPPSLEEETQAFNERIASLSEFFAQPRFAGIKRPYRPVDVASKQGALPVQRPLSASLADKLFALLAKAEGEKQPLHTMGAIDPIQMTQMAKHQEVLYVSGWASSSVLTTANNEVGPDLA